jgi:predicted lipoprotein with Yx(FWY)xxD motif
MRRALLASAVPVIAVIAAGCGSSSGPSTTADTTAATTASTTPATAAVASSTTVSTASVKGVGTVLVDAAGHTLYTFAPDMAKKVTCTSSTCQATWPSLAASGAPTGSGTVKASLLGTATGPNGAVVTYDGWPLYTFSGDSASGTADGQALDLNGGDWYAIAPSGTPVK